MFSSRIIRVCRGILSASVLAVLWFAAAPAHAQQGTAALTGTVTDVATGKPVADAVVTAVSPISQGEQLTVTDASGAYRIPGLPPGIYTLRLETGAYKPYVRDGIELRADTTIRVNAALLPEALTAEEVVVVARPPAVDVGSSATGMNISSDFTSRIPVSPPGAKGSNVRSFESVAEVVPQAQVDTYGVSVSGSSSPENRYFIDGLSVNNGAFGVIGTPLSMDFIQEVSVLSGGYMPEYGQSMGAMLNAITKSGSNEYRSSVFMNWAPGGLEGKRKAIGNTIVTRPGLNDMGDIGGDVSGPIIKDKLWFYAGFDWSRIRYDLNRTFHETRLDADGQTILDGPAIDGTSRTYRAQQDAIQGIAKLTWAASKRDRVTFSVNGNWLVPEKDGRFGIDPNTFLPALGPNSTLSVPLYGSRDAMAVHFRGSSTNAIAKWTHELDGKRLLLDTTLGFHHLSSGRGPSDGSGIGDRSGLASVPLVHWTLAAPLHSIRDFESVPAGACQPDPANPDAVACPVTEYYTGGAGFMSEQSINRYQGRSVLSWMFQGLGHHVFKAGVDLELFTYDHKKGYSGGNIFQEGDGTYYISFPQFGYLTGPDQAVILNSIHNRSKSVGVGAFVQDSWSVMDLFTLNLGLRYDAQLLYAGDGSLAMTLPRQWSPRVGLIYDYTREGRSKVFANYARYYQSVPLDIIDRTVTGEPYLYSLHDASMCDPNDPAQATGSCQSEDARFPGVGAAPNSLYGVANSNRTPVDPKLKAPSTDEVVLGWEHQVFRDARVGVTYTRRWLNHTIEDMSRDETQTYFVGNPGYGIAKDFPKAERIYNAGTLYFQKSFADQWLAQASYTLSKLEGNYAGLFRPEDAQLDPFMNSDFDLQSLTINRKGPLPGDHRHAIKLFGAYDIKIPRAGHLTPGISFRAFSGGPTSFLGANLFGQDLVFVLPRGAGDRLPWTYNFDLRLAYTFSFDKKRSIAVTADIFNLFNLQGITSRDQRYTSAQVNPVRSGGLGAVTTPAGEPLDASAVNPNFGKATGYQAPRVFRFGLKATF